jgi:hypothetical protein
MAVSTSSKFSIAAGAVPSVVGAFDKFEMHATPKYPCGYKVELADGSVSRYGHFGADTAQGRLVSQDISESSAILNAITVVAPASAVTITDGTIGSRYVEGTIASIAVDQYAGGKLLVVDNTGQGYTYDIVGNTATGDPASGNLRIELAQPLQVALDATSDVLVLGNLYANLEIATAASEIAIVGVTCANMDVSEAAWGWIQTWGVVACLQDGTCAIGDICTLSDGTSGAYQTAAGGGTQIADLVAEAIVGYQLITGATDGEGCLYLQLGN